MAGFGDQYAHLSNLAADKRGFRKSFFQKLCSLSSFKPDTFRMCRVFIYQETPDGDGVSNVGEPS
jgi:hypothetical protein